MTDTAIMEGRLHWRDIDHLQNNEKPLSPAMFRHDIASYVHPSHLADLSPMLDDPAIARKLARHHRLAPDLSRLIVDRFALGPADETDVESEGRSLVLKLHHEGSRRLLLIGACCLVSQIRQVIDGHRVGWLMNILSERGYVGVLGFGRSQSSRAQAPSNMQLTDCQSQSTLERMLDKTSWLAFRCWLSTQESAFCQRVAMMFPKGIDPAEPATGGGEFGAPLSDIMTAVSDMDVTEARGGQALA